MSAILSKMSLVFFSFLNARQWADGFDAPTNNSLPFRRAILFCTRVAFSPEYVVFDLQLFLQPSPILGCALWSLRSLRNTASLSYFLLSFLRSALVYNYLRAMSNGPPRCGPFSRQSQHFDRASTFKISERFPKSVLFDLPEVAVLFRQFFYPVFHLGLASGPASLSLATLLAVRPVVGT